MSGQNLSKLFEFFTLIGQLKRIQRTGWVLRKVKRPESVADHMYRMSVLSMLVDEKSGLNKERCMKMSLVHDMAESIVGDIAPTDCVDRQEKHRMEKTAMTHIVSLVSEEVGKELLELWTEYEEQTTGEAQFVKDLDRFDMVFQAFEYEQMDEQPRFLQEFFDSTEGKFKSPTVQGWVSELYRVRDQSSNIPEHAGPHDQSSNIPEHSCTHVTQISAMNTKNSATVRPFCVDHKEKQEKDS